MQTFIPVVQNPENTSENIQRVDRCDGYVVDSYQLTCAL